MDVDQGVFDGYKHLSSQRTLETIDSAVCRMRPCSEPPLPGTACPRAVRVAGIRPSTLVRHDRFRRGACVRNQAAPSSVCIGLRCFDQRSALSRLHRCQCASKRPPKRFNATRDLPRRRDFFAASLVVAEVPASQVHDDEEEDDGSRQDAAKIHPPWRALGRTARRCRRLTHGRARLALFPPAVRRQA